MPHKPDVPCAVCGKLIWNSNTSLPPGKATCRPCRKVTWEHGTRKAYHEHKCRCEVCKAEVTRAHRAYRAKAKADAKSRPACIEDGCDRPRASRSMCTMHYKRWATKNGMNRPPSSRWSDRTKSNHHARRARMGGSSKHSDKVMVSELVALGMLTCTWCGSEIDPTLKYPDPLSKSLDHTVPVSRGGSHTMDNVTLMHWICNTRKGTKPAIEVASGTQSNTR